MNTPIINPSTLTEEQRERLKQEYSKMKDIASFLSNTIEGIALNGAIVAFEQLFSKEFLI